MWVTISFDGEPVKLNTDLISELYPSSKVIKMSSGSEIDVSDEDYNKLEAKMFAKRKVVAKDDTELYEFMNHLNALLGNKGTLALTGDRRRSFEKLFKDGFSKEQIITAATNIGKSDFMRGKNDRGTIYAKVDYLFRSSGKDRVISNINRWQEAQTPKQKPMF